MSQHYPPPPPDAPDAAPGPRSRVLRWAVASAALGALMIYNSVDSSGTALPGPPPSAAAPPSATAPTLPAAGALRRCRRSPPCRACRPPTPPG